MFLCWYMWKRESRLADNSGALLVTRGLFAVYLQLGEKLGAC